MTGHHGRFVLEQAWVFDASVEQVFGMVTEPKELAKWWGPRGFTTPEIHIDFRVGGSLRFTMQPPDGEAFHLSGEFVEIQPPSRLRFTFLWDEPDPDDRETVVELSLDSSDGGTTVTLTQGVFATHERLELHRGGWADSFEKLDAVLRALPSPRRSPRQGSGSARPAGSTGGRLRARTHDDYLSQSHALPEGLAVSGAIATARTDIAAVPEKIWAALTDPDEISAWMAGSQVETTWEVGTPITWTGQYDGRTYRDKGEVLVVEEPRLLSMTHYSPLMGGPDVPENYHTLIYTLVPTDSGTRLELSQDGCDSDEQAQQFSQNWQRMLDTLQAHVEG